MMISIDEKLLIYDISTAEPDWMSIGQLEWLKFQTYSIHTRLDRLLFSGSKALQK